MRVVLFPLLALSLLLTACADATINADPAQQANPTVTPFPTAAAAARPTYPVQSGTVQEILPFTGRWLPRDQAQLSFEINGSIRSVNVQRGDSVSTGNLLADFQIDDLENQLVNAELDLESAQRRLDAADGGTQSVVDAQFNLASARLALQSTLDSVSTLSLENAQRELESAARAVENAQRSYDEALSRPESPASTVDNAREQLMSAQERLEAAQNSYLSAVQQYNQNEYNIARDQNNLIRAEMQLEDAMEGTGIDPDLVQAVRQSQINVNRIKEQIEQASLYAPFDGVILEITIRPGDAVQAFNSIITLALPEPSEVIANLAFNDTQRLDVGMIGTCQVANRPDTLVACSVRQIPFTSRDADQTARIAADIADFNLALGQLIEVEMPLQTRENVLWLPPQAIRTFQNRTFVVVRTPDGDRVVDVQVGLQTDDRVEIVSGLEEGDVVVGP